MRQSAMRAALLCAAFLSLCAIVVGSEAQADAAGTPVTKVLNLMYRLQNQVENQYAKDAAMYSGYKMFCDNQDKFKAEAIKNSDEDIAVWQAEEGDLEANIQSINGELLRIGNERTAKLADKTTAEDNRRTQFALYEKSEKDLTDAIKACKDAIAALKASKEDMVQSRLDAPTAFAQLSNAGAALEAVLDKSSAVKLPPGADAGIGALERAVMMVRNQNAKSQKKKEVIAGAPEEKKYAYQYHSNDIIATIRTLFISFTGQKKELDEEEGTNKLDYDKTISNLNSALALLDEQEATFKTQKFEKEMALAETKQNIDVETKEKLADGEFRTVLNQGCTAKATQWAEREATFKNELTAVKTAIATLKDSAVGDLYSANKKLVGLAAVKAVTKPAVKFLEKPSAAAPAHQQPVAKPVTKHATSFLQLQSDRRQEARKAVVRRVLQRLDSAAKRLGSAPLSALALRLDASQGAIDYFVKVRGIIKDLITKLEADATDEASEKKFCDDNMAEQLENRDLAMQEIEKRNAIIAEKSALKEKAEEDIKNLQELIALLNKAKQKAIKQREEEKADNEQTVKDAEAGEAATRSAMQTLQTFYAGSLAQVAYKPPNSDRYDETVSDVAPKIFSDEKYTGQQDSSKGIIGMLEVIVADFARTVETVNAEEAAAVTAHNEFISATDADILAKEGEVTTLETTVGELTEAITTAEGELKEEKTKYDAAQAQILTLKSKCVQATETYDERVAKREEEIKALKEALQILIEWKD